VRKIATTPCQIATHRRAILHTLHGCGWRNAALIAPYAVGTKLPVWIIHVGGTAIQYRKRTFGFSLQLGDSSSLQLGDKTVGMVDFRQRFAQRTHRDRNGAILLGIKPEIAAQGLNVSVENQSDDFG
jgi:hypothetical protein